MQACVNNKNVLVCKYQDAGLTNLFKSDSQNYYIYIFLENNLILLRNGCDDRFFAESVTRNVLQSVSPVHRIVEDHVRRVYLGSIMVDCTILVITDVTITIVTTVVMNVYA